MKDLVIGDLHFGIKSNSVTWLESQINFFNEQIFGAIETENPDRIVFLGDLFDIRYSINQQVGIEVKKIMRNLGERFTKPIVFVAGNHDYYSPLEEYAEYNAYNLIFGEEFQKVYPNFKFVTEEPYCAEDGALFLPWYWTENPNHFDEILYQFKLGNEADSDVKCIYAHVDLSVWPGPRIASLKGIPVYAGHIHFPITDLIGNLFNIGAALPLTFNDVNDTRHLYIIDNFKTTKRIENVTTPQFKRYFNEDIFTLNEDDFNNSYVQLYISTSNSNTAKYIDQLKYLKTTYYGANIGVRIVDDNVTIETVNSCEGFNTNIGKYIEDNIPEHLNNKYTQIKDKLNGIIITEEQDED